MFFVSMFVFCLFCFVLGVLFCFVIVFQTHSYDNCMILRELARCGARNKVYERLSHCVAKQCSDVDHQIQI